MTAAQRLEVERLIRRLENCPAPHRVDLHREAVAALKMLLAEVDGRQLALFQQPILPSISNHRPTK